MSMLKKLTDLANSEKGKEFADKATAKAKQLASDPDTRDKIDAARKKISDRVGGDKPAEADKTAAGGPTTGASSPTATPGGPTETGADSGAGDGGKAA